MRILKGKKYSKLFCTFGLLHCCNNGWTGLLIKYSRLRVTFLSDSQHLLWLILPLPESESWGSGVIFLCFSPCPRGPEPALEINSQYQPWTTFWRHVQESCLRHNRRHTMEKYPWGTTPWMPVCGHICPWRRQHFVVKWLSMASSLTPYTWKTVSS